MTKIKYKVVTLNRMSSSCLIRREWIGDYARQYNKGDVVTAESRSIGLLVFDRMKQAEDFIMSFAEYRKLMIIKVEVEGEGRVPISILSGDSRDYIGKNYSYSKLDDFFSIHSRGLWVVPEGTRCYPTVRVVT